MKYPLKEAQCCANCSHALGFSINPEGEKPNWIVMKRWCTKQKEYVTITLICEEFKKEDNVVLVGCFPR